jgi:hypothetical protein
MDSCTKHEFRNSRPARKTKFSQALQDKVNAAYLKGGDGRDSLVYTIAVQLFEERLQKHGT